MAGEVALEASHCLDAALAFEIRSGCGVPSREILGNHGVVAIRGHCCRAGTSTAGAPRLPRDTRHDERPPDWRENWREASAAAWLRTPAECFPPTRILQISLYSPT
jgi:hypothetical protein